VLIARARRAARALFLLSHDLNIVRLLSDRVLVMYLGQIVEQGPAEQILEPPAHPSPTVCRFYGRCPEGFDRCRHERPVLRSVGDGPHPVACHRLEGERLERSLVG